MDIPSWWPSKKPYIIGDCLEGMKAIPNEVVSLIIGDPPYGINYVSGRENYKGHERKTPNTIVNDDRIDTRWLTEAFRILKPNSMLFLFSRWDVIHKWAEQLSSAGFKIIERLVWDKTHWGMGNLEYYGSQTEDILFCIKGYPKMQWVKRRGNVIKTVSKRSLPEGMYHPNQKSLSLIAKLIIDTTAEGDTVFDPFLGSGTTLEACRKTNRNGVGFEIDKIYETVIQERAMSNITNIEGYGEDARKEG